MNELAAGDAGAVETVGNYHEQALIKIKETLCLGKIKNESKKCI